MSYLYAGAGPAEPSVRYGLYAQYFRRRRRTASVAVSHGTIITFPGGSDVMKLKPLNDRVLVKRLETEEKTAGGLYIPDTAKEKPSKGQVVAVGPGKVGDNGERTALAVKAGDEVLFNKYAGTEVKLDGVDHLVMREEDILAIID